jgi:hypothetical protein
LRFALIIGQYGDIVFAQLLKKDSRVAHSARVSGGKDKTVDVQEESAENAAVFIIMLISSPASSFG